MFTETVLKTVVPTLSVLPVKAEDIPAECATANAHTGNPAVYAITARAYGLCIHYLHADATLEQVMGYWPVQAHLVAMIAALMMKFGCGLTLERCGQAVSDQIYARCRSIGRMRVKQMFRPSLSCSLRPPALPSVYWYRMSGHGGPLTTNFCGKKCLPKVNTPTCWWMEPWLFLMS